MKIVSLIQLINQQLAHALNVIIVGSRAAQLSPFGPQLDPRINVASQLTMDLSASTLRNDHRFGSRSHWFLQ